MGRLIRVASTWWAKAWWELLERYMDSGRLSRARSYFKNGKVANLRVVIDRAEVTSEVMGSYGYPYEVAIRFPSIPEAARKRFMELLGADDVVKGRLLENTFDPRVGVIADEAGFSLIPKTLRGVRVSCTCPDDTTYCKHVAATFATLLASMDEDPALLFEVQGWNFREDLRTLGHGEIASMEGLLPHHDERALASAPFAAPAERLRAALEAEGLTTLAARIPYYELKPVERGFLLLFPVNDGGSPSRAVMADLYHHVMDFAAGIRLELFAPFEGRPPYADAIEAGVEPLSVSTAFIDGVPLLSDDAAPVVPGDVNFRDFLRMPAAYAALHSEVLALKCVLRDAGLALLEKGLVRPVAGVFSEGRMGSVMYAPLYERPDVAAVIEGVEAVWLRVRALEKGVAPEAFAADPSLLPRSSFILEFETMLTALVNASGFTGRTRQGNAQADAKLEAFLGPFARTFPQRVDRDEFLAFFAPAAGAAPENDFTPVLTIRRAPEAGAWLNVGVLLPDEVAAARESGREPRPVPYREILSKAVHKPLRYPVTKCMERFSMTCQEIDAVVESKGRSVSVNREALPELLFECLPALEMAGFRVHLPRSFREMLKPSLSASVSVKQAHSENKFDLASLTKFEWEPRVGDIPLTREELDRLLARAGEIVEFKEHLVYLDPETIRKMKEALDAGDEDDGFWRMRVALSGGVMGFPLELDHELEERLEALREVPEYEPPAGLHATLRPYQKRGWSWLRKNAELGLGSLIADDMGLGKTIQVIALIEWLKESGRLEGKGVLAVVPTSLLTNWEREVARFAPGLNVLRYHGPKRAEALDALLDGEGEADIILTSYGTAMRDAEKLRTLPWHTLVLDEAQALKNPQTATHRAITSLGIPHVVAMSGTPVENRLLEYWSILSVVVPGLLGSARRFTEEFAMPIEGANDPVALERFRAVVAPFMLRRVKTDRSIAPDLPEKIVSDRYVGMTHEQAELYRHEVEQAMEAMAKKEEAARPGTPERTALVFRLMTHLKQICNSPSQFLGTEAKGPDSGKAAAFMELVTEALDAGRKVLVFTQYREMGERLCSWLAPVLGRAPDFLHGGVSVKERQAMVDRIQTRDDARVLVISLKAGGTGLNLTRADTVIHYDLWWNPAVENQATDRAFRIGQKNNVNVYRLVTQGTFEEKINARLREKAELQEMTVGTGERWIGELSGEELRDLFALPAVLSE